MKIKQLREMIKLEIKNILNEENINNSKFKLTSKTIRHEGKTLYRIQALKDFDNVFADELGGYVESENNLSNTGNCWIYDDAKVYDNAKVYGNAQICDKAEVYDNAKVYGDAMIYGNAYVYGDTKIYGQASIFDEAHIFDAAVDGNANIKQKNSY